MLCLYAKNPKPFLDLFTKVSRLKYCPSHVLFSEGFFKEFKSSCALCAHLWNLFFPRHPFHQGIWCLDVLWLHFVLHRFLMCFIHIYKMHCHVSPVKFDFRDNRLFCLNMLLHVKSTVSIKKKCWWIGKLCHARTFF